MTDTIIRHLGDLDLHGNLTLVSQVTDFPANPRIGTMVMKNNCMYVYALIGSLETWYPYASATASYIHTQGLAAQTWTVTHNLDSLNLWFQVKDSDGNILAVNKTDVNRNVFTLNFTTPVVGTVVVVAPEKIDVPQVRTTGLIVGSNNEVVVDSSGVLINGSYAITTAGMVTAMQPMLDAKAPIQVVSATTSTTTLSPDIGSLGATYQYGVSAQAVALTITAPVGTPFDGQKLTIRLKDNGSSQTVAWNAAYRVVGTTLPTATTASKTSYVGCVYNAADLVWDVIAVTSQV